MTITLQAGHTYRDRAGAIVGPIKVWEGFTEDATGLPLYVASDTDDRYWRQNGLNGEPYTGPKPMHDLVEEVLPTPAQPSSPVRQRTVTEIVPGAYGRISVKTGIRANDIMLHLVAEDGNVGSFGANLNAEELRALAATATLLADALDAIAADSQS